MDAPDAVKVPSIRSTAAHYLPESAKCSAPDIRVLGRQERTCSGNWVQARLHRLAEKYFVPSLSCSLLQSAVIIDQAAMANRYVPATCAVICTEKCLRLTSPTAHRPHLRTSPARAADQARGSTMSAPAGARRDTSFQRLQRSSASPSAFLHYPRPVCRHWRCCVRHAPIAEVCQPMRVSYQGLPLSVRTPLALISRANV